jgi:hypothetical protein
VHTTSSKDTLHHQKILEEKKEKWQTKQQAVRILYEEVYNKLDFEDWKMIIENQPKYKHLQKTTKQTTTTDNYYDSLKDTDHNITTNKTPNNYNTREQDSNDKKIFKTEKPKKNCKQNNMVKMVLDTKGTDYEEPDKYTLDWGKDTEEELQFTQKSTKWMNNENNNNLLQVN